MPRSAIVGGEEDGQPVFIARAFHEGGVREFSSLTRFCYDD
jgi:hypothetical protein